jgi:hypothetical protein
MDAVGPSIRDVSEGTLARFRPSPFVLAITGAGPIVRNR